MRKGRVGCGGPRRRLSCGNARNQEKADILDNKHRLWGVNIARNEQNDEKGVADESD